MVQDFFSLSLTLCQAKLECFSLLNAPGANDIKLLLLQFTNVYNKVECMSSKPFMPGLIFEGKASSLP